MYNSKETWGIYFRFEWQYFTWRWMGFHWEESYEFGGNIVKMSKASKDGECFYGLGDKLKWIWKGKD
jgi:hypothetical protein